MSDTDTRRCSTLALTASALGLSFAAPLALANDAAERLTERLEPLESYQASFEQQISGSGGERLQEARGEMWLSRPGLLRWEVEAPYSQVVVSDGDEVFLYDPDLEQVTVQAMDNRVSHTPALLLSGSTYELTDNFDVSHDQQGSEDVFTLIPTSNETLFEEMSMVFEGDTLTELLMTDSTGQRTLITFDNVVQNGRIDRGMFDFEIPEGTDVIRESY